VCAHRYVDLSEPTWGVAVLNDGRYGHGVQDGGIRVSLLRAAKYPDPLQDHGHHHVTIAIMPHGAGLVDVIREAEAMNLPLRVVAPGSREDLPTPLVTVHGDGVELSAVKTADDGSGDVIVRLYESLGGRAPTTVKLPFRIVDARRCNLLEEAQAPIDTGDGIVAITLQPFELVTLRLR
jgi:alpha-mannosidase